MVKKPEPDRGTRSEGQDPDPRVRPSGDEGKETPDATATPPQATQHAQSNVAKAQEAGVVLPGAAAAEENDPTDTGERYKVRILRGAHSEGGRIYTKGDVFESKTDLVARFGTEKFEDADEGARSARKLATERKKAAEKAEEAE